MSVRFDDVREAAARIAGRVHRTPVLTSRAIDESLGCRVFFKCENLQKVGAFKARGAVNAVFALGEDDVRRGVVTHSSGNHAAALAYAASQRGVPCAVVMPETAPAVKVTAVRGYGADVVFCKQSERESTCTRVSEERGMVVVHPFENPHVIAGQGTAALELLEEVDGLDCVITPVGGGGLLAGTAVTCAALRPGMPVFGADPDAVDDAARSMASGQRQPRVEDPHTACDGLLTALGQPNFELLRAHAVRVLTAPERTILEAARNHLERMKTVVEPSGAVALAVLMTHAEQFRGQRVGAVISGGNTDFRWMCPSIRAASSSCPGEC